MCAGELESKGLCPSSLFLSLLCPSCRALVPWCVGAVAKMTLALEIPQDDFKSNTAISSNLVQPKIKEKNNISTASIFLRNNWKL